MTKAGKKTYGIDRFFSSLYGKSLSGLSFFTLSLISVQQRHSFPIRVEQTIVTREEKERAKAKSLKKKSANSKAKKGSKTDSNNNQQKKGVERSSWKAKG